MADNFTCPRTCPFHRTHFCRFNAVLRPVGGVRVHSHTATIDVTYDDPDVLRRAVLALGGVWIGAGTHNLGDTQQTGHGFRLPMANSVNDTGYWYHPIVLRSDKKLAYDEYGGRWGDVAGLAKLKGEYAIQKAIASAEAMGWQTDRSGDAVTIYHPQGGVLTITADGTLDAAGFVGEGCHAAVAELGIVENNVNRKPVKELATVCVGG